MARHTLLFYFLQFLPLLASANAGFNATIANCIDFDMANIEELISTLWTVENSEIKALDGTYEDKEKNQPFGYLKIDWFRLQLLQDALPVDSALKDKFKHIFRILLIAHNQASKFLHFLESTKIQDAVEKKNTIFLTDKNNTDAEEVKKNSLAENEDFHTKNQEIKAKLNDALTTTTSVVHEDFIDTNEKSSFYGIDATYSKSIADGEDAIEIKGISTKLDEARKNDVATKSIELDPLINSPTTIAAPIPILEAMESPTAASIFNADTTISEGGINISTSIHEESRQSAVTSLSESTFADEEVISMRQATKMILGMKSLSSFGKYTVSTTERMIKEEYEEDVENSSFETIPNVSVTEIQLLNSSSSENDLLSMKGQQKDKYSLQPAIKIDPVLESSITEKYPSLSTISNILITTGQSFVSMSSNKLEIPSLQKTENISWVQSTTNTLLAENFTTSSVEKTLETENRSNTQLNPKIEDSGTSDATKVSTTENTSVGSPTIEEKKVIELGISNKESENSSNINLTSDVWTTNSTVNILNITTAVKDPEIKLTAQQNQNGDSMSEKSIPKILSTKDWIENVSKITPTIRKNEDNILANRSNRTEGPINEKSTANLSATKNPMEKISDVPITIEKERKSEITSPNNQTANSTDYFETISNITPTIENNKDNKLANRNNRTEDSINEESTVNLSATKNPMEKISDVPITIEKERKSEITSPNNQMANSTDYFETISNITPTIENSKDNKLASRNNRTEASINEKSTANLSATKNPIEKISDVPITIEKERKSEITSSNNQMANSTDYFETISNITPTTENSKDNKLASRNNRTEVPINEQSTANLSATKNPMEQISDVPITIKKERKNEITSPNNQTANSTDYFETISNITPTIENNKDNKLANRNNRTEASINEKSTANLSATTNPMENTSNVPIGTEHNRKDGITSLNNETEKLSHVNIISEVSYTTDSIKRTSIVTSKVDKNEDNKLRILNNQTEFLTNDNSTFNINETINPSNHVTAFISSIEYEKIDSTSKINQNEKSIPNQWINKYSTDSVQITTPTSTMFEELKSITQNDETNLGITDKSVTLNSAVNTSYNSTNTIQFVAGTSIPNASYETTQYFVSIKPSQQTETSTQIYVSEKSTIITNKIEMNIPMNSESKNKSEVSKVNFSTENVVNNQNNLQITSNNYEHITNFNQSLEPRSDSETWNTNSKPAFVKNPLNTGSSRSNKIFQDFRHESDDNGHEKNVESPQIVLYETGTGAKTGSVWRPHLVRQQPTGNNIWRFDNFPKNVGPYNYDYKQPTVLPINSKTDIRKDQKNPVKFSGQRNRMNLLGSRKRGSANSDVEKQFRWFYRRGRTETAHESRDKENVNRKIKIQCKKTHRR